MEYKGFVTRNATMENKGFLLFSSSEMLRTRPFANTRVIFNDFEIKRE